MYLLLVSLNILLIEIVISVDENMNINLYIFVLQLEEWFINELSTKRKFIIKKMKTDGACLFRSVG